MRTRASPTRTITVQLVLGPEKISGKSSGSMRKNEMEAVDAAASRHFVGWLTKFSRCSACVGSAGRDSATTTAQRRTSRRVSMIRVSPEDIRDLLIGFAAAIELDQVRVDAPPPEKVHPDYDDRMWRRWRRIDQLLPTI